MTLLSDDDVFGAPSSAPLMSDSDVFGDSGEAEKSNPLRRYLADPAISLLKGAIGVPEAAVGVADMATAGHAGKFLEDSIGFKPKEAKNILNELYSPEQRAANEKVQNADGFTNTLGEIAHNPSVVPHAVIESLPVMGAGGIVARGIPAGSAAIRGAMGEGLTGAGSAAEQTRQETKDGLLTTEQVALSGASGAGTFAFGAAGGKIANKLGIGDVDTMIAGGAPTMAKGVGKKGFLRSAVEGTLSEGGFEEMPQSVWEQAMQNMALDKPWYDNVGNSAAMGLVTGGAMGAGGGLLGAHAERGEKSASPEDKNPLSEIAGLLPAPVYPGMEGADIIKANVARENAVGAAQANADKIYAERDAYEAAMKAAFPQGMPTITEPVAPIQAQIDEALGIDQARLTPKQRQDYEKELKALIDTPVGITHDQNGLEIPLTMGALLSSQATVESVVRDRRSQAANAQAVSAAAIPPVPVVGPLSEAANVAIQTGMADAVRPVAPAPEPVAPVYPVGSEEKGGTFGDGGAGRVVVKNSPDGSFTVTASWDKGTAKKTTGSSFPAGTDVNQAIAQVAQQHGGFTASTETNQAKNVTQPEPAAAQAEKASSTPAVVPVEAEKLQDAIKPAVALQPSADAAPVATPSTVMENDTHNAEVYRPLVERLIRNKRNAKELGFDIDGAIAKAKEAMNGKKQMPGSFRSLAAKAEKRGDTETAEVLRQIADLNDARKNPPKKEETEKTAPEAAKEDKSNIPEQSDETEAPAIKGNPRQAGVNEKTHRAGKAAGFSTADAVTDSVGWVHYPFKNEEEITVTQNKFGTGTNFVKVAHLPNGKWVAGSTASDNMGGYAGSPSVFSAQFDSRDEAINSAIDTAIKSLTDEKVIGKWEALRKTLNLPKSDAIHEPDNEKPVDAAIADQAAIIDEAAHEAATSPQNDIPLPTEAQREAMNYKMGHVTLHGLDITIENPQGSVRSGVDADGKPWENTLANHYGYIKGTEGNDGDHVDVFIGDNPESVQVFIVDQKHTNTGDFDEHKVLLGFNSMKEAKAGYANSYQKGWMLKGVIGVTPATLDELKAWLKEDDKTAPYSSARTKTNSAVAQNNDSEKYQWMRNKEGGQAFGNQLRIEPLNALLYGKHVKNLIKDGLSYEDYRNAHPDATHIGLVSLNKGASWKVAGVGSLEDLRPKAMQWAKKVASFDSEEAVSHGQTADSEKADGGKPKTLPERIDAAKEKSDPNPLDKKAVTKHTKTYERDAHTATLADAGLMELAGTAGLDAFTRAAESVVLKHIEELTKDAETPEQKTALAAMVADGKPVLPKTFFESAHKSMKRSWENAQKEAARDPEVYKETLRWGLSVKQIAPDSEDAEKYKTGFDHALRGQTKSTLPNDVPAYLDGYNDARAWIATEDGRAWHDGKRIEKQKNTGIVLKRWWERKRKDIDALDKTDKQAWEGLLKATARADIFPMEIISADATPGAKSIMEALRANVATFQDFYWGEATKQGSWGKHNSPLKVFTGDYQSYRGRLSGEVNANDEERLAISKDIAREYQEKLGDFAGKFKDAKTMADIEAVIDALFFPGGRLDEKGKHKDWEKSPYYLANEYLFVANRGKLRGVLPLFAADSWELKYSKWAIAKATEDVERKGKDRKDSITRPRLDRITRTGLDNPRGSKNITAQEFKKKFGFADVVLGQYVTAQQGQDHINYAYDALMTMAGLLGAKPTQLSFGGKLYFTIGALGHGKYAAHFAQNQPVEINGEETAVPVINVTATRGDGSVLHEFFHAIDFLTTDRALKKAIQGVKDLLVSVPPSPEQVIKTAEEFLSGSRYFRHGTRKTKDTPQEQAIYALDSYYRSKDRDRKTDFYAEALILDKGSSKPYWSNDAEPFARMAEAWGFDKLRNATQQDEYLVSDYVMDGKYKRPKHRAAPYPLGEERVRLNAVFERLIDQIEWTDAGPVLKADSAWQTINPYNEARKPYTDALDAAIANIEAIEAGRKEKLAQAIANREAEAARREKEKQDAIFAKPDMPAVDEPPAAGAVPEADNVGLSEDELSAIFDEEAAALRESTQEEPNAPEPGVAVTAAPSAWAREDYEFLLDKANSGQIVLMADAGPLGLPTIHDLPSDSVHHMGYGVFRVSTAYWEGTYTAGGAMDHTPGGLAYTTISMTRGERPDFYDPDVVKAKISGKLISKAGPRAAPKLTDEQDKTAAVLAKEMAKHGVTGIDEALKGLVAIFGGGAGRLQSFPGGFDEDAYEAAKPHFKAAAEAFNKAGLAFKDFVRLFFRSLIAQFGDGVKPYALRFAKDYEAEFMSKQAEAEENQDAPEQGDPETADSSPSTKLAQWVGTQLANHAPFDWRSLFRKADWFFGGTQANGMYSVKDAYDAMELGVNQYLLENKTLFQNADTAVQAKKIIDQLDAMLKGIATQTKRTDEMDEFQQFSTPPTYAYLANWVANLNATDSYLEPSAGIGGMAVFGKIAGVKTVAVNELSARRLSVLRNLPFDRFFAENAEQLNNVLPDDLTPTVIVMNPPFSATAGRSQGQRDTMNGAKHIEQALKRLAPGGRLVAIVGEGMAADKPLFKAWWKKTQTEFNVRANIGIEGAGYVKYGTTFDNQILVIDKNGPTSGAVVTGKVATPAEALTLLENIRVSRPVATQSEETNRVDSQPAGQQGSGAAAQAGEVVKDSVDAGATGPSGVGRGGSTDDGAGQHGGRSDAANSNDAGDGQPLGGRRGESAESGQPGRGNSERPDGAGNATASSRSDVEPSGLTLDSATGATGAGEISNAVFEQYTPQKVRIPGAVPHNTPLVESSALASVVPPDPTYTPNLPEGVVKKGQLSDAQLEAIVYAGQAQEQQLPDGKTRRGFFLGDGTGVGKGRQISGVIMDNMRRGREKAIWISKKKELIVDAKRDFGDIGGNTDLFIDLGKKIKLQDKIQAEKGILFAGYPTIRSTSKAANLAKKLNKGRRQDKNGISYERVQQIVDWVGADFDGALIFDEAHEMGNAVPVKGKRGKTKPSDQALACLELQRALPNARVMYVSATGATEVSNLAYAERLGVWGEGTPFQDVLSFVNELSRSVSAMELVAQNLKQMGLYLARSLSYDGVEYTRLEHTMTDYQRETYDMLSGAWQGVLQNIDKALETTGVMEDGKASGRESGKVKSSVMSAFWGTHQRFFNQIITASQMPSVIRQIKDDLAANKSVVLQITNTNEADLNRALAKMAGNKLAEEEDSDSIEELDLTPRDQLINFVLKAFPIMQFEKFSDENGNENIRQALDANGQPIINREAVAMRDELINGLKNIEVPDSPLQMVINEFGPEMVAEITGRTQRVIQTKDGKYKTEKRGANAVAADSTAFSGGKKRILIFSQAGGTGFSFHSNKTFKNQQQRAHYVLQAGWSADKAVQGFGRSHRTNQASAPIYRLVSTNVPAQKRFISSIARRLEQLGALTAGQRDTAGGSMFSATDNLESKYATAAVRQFFEANRPGQSVADVPVDVIEQMGLKGIYDPLTGALLDTKIPPVTQFLNRLLSLRLDTQTGVFDFFIRALEVQIDVAKRTGQFDDGLQTIRHEGAKALTEQNVYQDPRTGATTKYVEVAYETKNPMYTFDTANVTIKAADKAGWFKNSQSHRIAGVWQTNQVRTDKDGRIHKLHGIWRTSGSSYEAADSFDVSKWARISEDEAKSIWMAENDKRPKTVSKRLHMVVGGILPIWDRFNNEHVGVVRLGLDDGRRLLGRQIAEKDLTATMDRLNVESVAAKMTPEAIARAVLDGAKVELSNGMSLKLVKVSGENRIELLANNKWIDSVTERAIKESGGIYERIEYKPRYFIPADPMKGGAALGEMMRRMAMNAVSLGNNDHIEEGAGNAASDGRISPADKAVYGMAAEGKSAAEILKFIASATRNPFYRQLAKLLQQTGISPTITVGDAKGWKFNAGDGKYAAAYNPKTDTVALFRPAASERNTLHEFMHAATLAAMAKKGIAAQQMRALYQHVKSTGKLKGMYGMADVDEFIAEAFTNPKFQQALKKINAPSRVGGLANAWQWFVRVVRGILGLQQGDHSALSAALEIGVGVMRENMRAKQGGSQRDMIDVDGVLRPMKNANGDLIHPTEEGTRNFWRWIDGLQRERLDRKNVESGRGEGDKGSDKRVAGWGYLFDDQGRPRVFYHGTNADISAFDLDHPDKWDHGWLGRGVYLGSDPELANFYARQKAGQSNVMPMYMGVTNPYVFTVKEKQKLRNATKAQIDAITTRLQDNGYDGGVLEFGDGSIELVAFKNTAVKSASGNIGKFDQRDADIRYNLTEHASNQLYDLFHADNKFNWLHKSISTQFHKATIDADFKKVFDIGQKYLLDNSRFAMDAADTAPSLLQKLGALSDVFKPGAKREDIEAVVSPIFTGTLDKVLYTDAQLRDKYKLTEPQIGLYREFRAGINKSLEDLGVSEMARISKAVVGPAVIEQAKSAKDFNTATQILHGALLQRAETLIAQSSEAREEGDNATAKKLEADALLAERAADDVNKKAGRISQLKGEGYAPLMRFGEYAVDVTQKDEKGEVERIYFGMYETQREANAAARAFKTEYPDADVRQGPMDTESWKLFGGVDPSSLEVFAEAVGADESAIFQDFLRLTLNNRSALKRLMKREGVAGFSKDVPRVLSQFVTSNARLSAKNYHFGDMKQAVMDIPKMKGDVKNEAAKLAGYLQNPNEEMAPLRGYLFIHFLGGSIASALTNMTQPFTMTLPYLAQYGGAGKAGVALAKASKLYASGKYDPELEKAMKLAEREGITAPHEIHQLYAESERGLGRNIWMRKGLRVWGSMFSLAEAYNRHLTFIAAFNVARETGQADPFAFAQTAVEATQGIYNKGNRPDWARGSIGATVFTFKQFSVAYVEFLSRLYKNDKKAFALAMAIMFMGAGAEGWPFAEDLEDLIDTIGQMFGFSTNSKQWLRKNAKEVFGEMGGDFFRKGVSSIPGMPIDISSRVGVSNLIPGSAMFKVSEVDKTRDIFEFIGPLGGMLQSVTKGVEAARRGDVAGAVKLAAPVALQNMAKGADMLHYGSYRDAQGRKVVDTGPGDALAKAIGFQPNKVAKESAKIREMQQSIAHQRVIKDEIADKWAAGIFDKKPEQVKEAQADLRAWNLKNPDARISIAPEQISTRLRAMHSTREQRFIKTTPKEMRGQVLKELRG